MHKYNFNLRKANSPTPTPINLVIRWNKQRLMYSTHESIHPRFWELDRKKKNFQRAKETKQFPEYPEFNTRLENILSTAKTVFRQYLNDNDGKEPSIEELKDLLDIKLRNAEVKKKLHLYQFIEQFIEESKSRTHLKTGKKLSTYTIYMYKQCLKTVRDFSAKYQVRSDFDTIDLNWYHQYLHYLTKDLNLAQNTAGTRVKNLKVFLSEAVERGLTTNFAFKSKKFKKLTEENLEIYLTEEELKEMENLDLTANKKLDRARDLFLLGAWTGLRFSDFVSILPESIDEKYIKIKTKKTSEKVVIPILKSVRNILQKWKNITPNSLPPAISNVKMNESLKELGKLMPCLNIEVTKGITKGGVYIEKTVKKHELLKTHTARRSFATNAYKRGIPSLAIMRITSHTTEKNLKLYIKASPTEHAILLKDIWEPEERAIGII